MLAYYKAHSWADPILRSYRRPAQLLSSSLYMTPLYYMPFIGIFLQDEISGLNNYWWRLFGHCK